jgi:hypothetical protein
VVLETRVTNSTTQLGATDEYLSPPEALIYGVSFPTRNDSLPPHEEIPNMTTCEHKGSAVITGASWNSKAQADVLRSTLRRLPFERTDALKPGLGWWYDNT